MVPVLVVPGTVAETIADQTLAAHGITMDRASVCPGAITGVTMDLVSIQWVTAVAGAGKIIVDPALSDCL